MALAPTKDVLIRTFELQLQSSWPENTIKLVIILAITRYYN